MVKVGFYYIILHPQIVSNIPKRILSDMDTDGVIYTNSFMGSWDANDLIGQLVSMSYKPLRDFYADIYDGFFDNFSVKYHADGVDRDHPVDWLVRIRIENECFVFHNI